MIDRATNLLVLFIIFVTIIVFGDTTVDKWRHSEPWEKAWVLKNPSVPAPLDSKTLVTAYRNAYNAENHAAASRFLEITEQFFTPSAVLVRFSESEIRELATILLISPLYLLLPICLNYLRHGGVRLWNRSAAKSRPQRPPAPSEP